MAGTPDGKSLRDRTRRALLEAMRARDATAVAALRSALAVIDNAEAVEVQHAPTSQGVIPGAVDGLGAGEAQRRTLSEPEMDALVRAEVTERQGAAAQYRHAGRDDAAERLAEEADVLAALLGDPGTDTTGRPG